MRRNLVALGLAGLAGAGLYARRRAVLGRLLGLRPPEHRVAVTRDVAIPMPDGVTLYADHLRPREPGSYPTILIRTPYGRPSETGLVGELVSGGPTFFAERGYNVVVHGTRGRYRSGGAFDPFVNERADGLATLEWVAAQPWFDGNLGMFGASYVGYTQWAVAADAPPYLKALVPVITTTRFAESFYPGGAYAYETTLRWANGIHHSRKTDTGYARERLFSPRREAALRQVLATAPFAEADRATAGATLAFYQRWLAEGGPDTAYWREVDHPRALREGGPAVHLVAGWYDIFLTQQLDDYSDLLAAGRTPSLTVLPRAHTPRAIIDSIAEGLWWFDAHLKGRAELLQRRPVRLALMGSDEWHTMGFWPPPARSTRYYLQAGGGLATTPSGPGVSSYRYDPRDPTPSLGGPVLSAQAGARDQRPLEARRDVLCFTSAPLSAPLDVIGYVRLELYARSSLAHTDFVGRLCDVGPDGRSRNVCEGLIRVAPGVGEPQPDGSLRLVVELWATAQRFNLGHRLRLHVCSAAHPRWSANSGDGRPLAEGAPAGPPADQTIFHDDHHPSALILPIVSDETRRAMAEDGRT